MLILAIILIVIAFLKICFFLWLLFNVIRFPILSSRRLTNSYDCLFVLGSKVNENQPRPALKRRLDKAYQLYRENKSRHLILSGGKTSSEELIESLVMSLYLRDMGIEPKAIFNESSSRNTFENFKFSKMVMDREGFKQICVITSRHHLYRSYLISRHFSGYTFFFCAADDPLNGHAIVNITKEMLSLVKYFYIELRKKIGLWSKT